MSGSDCALAADLAVRAGRLLLDLRRRGSTQLGRLGDRAAHDFLTVELSAVRPADVVVSEEGFDADSRLTAQRVWIVDPLDGTREYADPPRCDWAVHVALWAAGELVAGAVALPALQAVYSTQSPPSLPPVKTPPSLVVSRSRPPDFAALLAARLGGSVATLGSAGAKVAGVLRGDYAAYVHAGGMYEWDSAAPVAVARAAGLHASHLDGSPLRYNQPDLLQADLLVCHPELQGRLLTELAQLIYR